MIAPFSKSWWVEPNLLLAGCYPGDLDIKKTEEKLTALLDAGIRNFICLQCERESNWQGQSFTEYWSMFQEFAKKYEGEISWQRFAIVDDYTPTIEQMKEILETIDSMIEKKSPTYVHCWGGHGRTGTVVGCWLVSKGMTGEEALEHIVELRKHDIYLSKRRSPRNPWQKNMILQWK